MHLEWMDASFNLGLFIGAVVVVAIAGSIDTIAEEQLEKIRSRQHERLINARIRHEDRKHVQLNTAIILRSH